MRAFILFFVSFFFPLGSLYKIRVGIYTNYIFKKLVDYLKKRLYFDISNYNAVLRLFIILASVHPEQLFASDC